MGGSVFIIFIVLTEQLKRTKGAGRRNVDDDDDGWFVEEEELVAAVWELKL